MLLAASVALDGVHLLIRYRWLNAEPGAREGIWLERNLTMARIRAVVVEGDRVNGYKRIQVLFGTNYFLEIQENDGKVSFLLGAHHEAFKADASEAKGQLENYIREIIENHPDSVFEEI